MNSIIQNKTSRKLFYGMLALLLGGCFIRYALQINIPPVVILAAAILAIVLGDHDEIMAMCICCIPLHTAFDLFYAVLVGLFVFAVKCSKGIRVNRSIIPVFLMVLWETLHCFGEAFAPPQFVISCLPLLLLMLLMCCANIKFNYDFIARAFAIATIGMCITLIGKLLYFAGFNVYRAFINLQRLGLNSPEARPSQVIAGGDMNPNALGILCVLGLTGLLQIRSAGRGKRKDIPMMVFLLAFGVMTSSRTFLACLLLMALMLLFSQKGRVSDKIKFLAVVLCACLVALLLLNLIVPNLLEYYIGRFRVKDITTGRLDLMVLYHRFIMSKRSVLPFGIGLHDFGLKVVDFYRVHKNVPHNGIQELIVAWGLPGLAMFIALCMTVIRRSRPMARRRGLINYIPAAIILFKAQAGQMFTSPYTMLAFSFAYLSLCADLRRPEDIDFAETESHAPAKDFDGVPFERAAATLWRKALVIIAVSVAGAVASVAINTYAVTPKYESSAMFYVNNNSININDVAESISSGDITASRRLVDSYIVILNARETLNKVIEYSGVDMDYDELKEMIHVGSVEETEIFRVTVTSESPAEAERIANAIAAVFPERISEIIQGTAAKVVDYAVIPSSPSSPGRVVNAMLGFILGFVFIVLVILLREIGDTTIRKEDDIEEIVEVPMLAAIPDLNRREKRRDPYYE